jgi:hypothetical protein
VVIALFPFAERNITPGAREAQHIAAPMANVFVTDAKVVVRMLVSGPDPNLRMEKPHDR